MDFAQALEGKASDFEPPKLQPVGTYVWAVSKPFAQTLSGKGDWDIVTFFVKCLSAEEDVDPDDLDDFGSVKNLPQRVVFLFPKSPDDKNNWLKTMDEMKSFLYSTLMVEETDSMKADMASATNSQFLGVIKHSKDSRSENGMQAEIGAKAPVD